MRHLLEMDAKRIAFIGRADEVRQHAQRWRGAQDAVAQWSNAKGVKLTRHLSPGLNIAAGVAAGEELLASDARPQAIFCANDVLAFGVYRALVGAGLEVPTDVRLIGYDDIEFARDWIVPLSSVRQPTRELGEVATRLLLAHSSGDPLHEHQRIVLSPELVIRRSTVAAG